MTDLPAASPTDPPEKVPPTVDLGDTVTAADADTSAETTVATGQDDTVDESAERMSAKPPTMRGAQSALLTFEGVVVWLGIIAAVALTDTTASVAVPVGVILAIVCICAAGLLRRPYGLVVGSIVQVLVLASGFVVPAMFVLGVIFAGLWALTIVLDRRMEADRATRARNPTGNPRGGEPSGDDAAPPPREAPDDATDHATRTVPDQSAADASPR